MNFALLFGAGAGLTWLTGPPTKLIQSIENEDEDAFQPIRTMVDQVIKNPKTQKRISNRPNPRDFPVEHNQVFGESDQDEEELEGPLFINPKRELKTITTELVNKAFLSRKKDLFRFLRLVIETYTNAIDLYCIHKSIPREKVRFVYKGGNVLRIVASEFLIELPGFASDIINDFYMPFFKRSDADFSIYIHPKLKNFDEVHTELTQLAWLLQQHIRERIIISPQNYFYFFDLNKKAKLKILESYLLQLNQANVLNDPTNSRFFQGKFLGVEFENTRIGTQISSPSRSSDTFIAFLDPSKKDTTVTFIPRPDKRHYLRIQYNTSLDFKTAGERAAFHLVRTKLIFATRFKNEAGMEMDVKIGGELIDVSLPKREDKGLHNFFNSSNVVEKYELKQLDQSLQFYGYTLSYLIKDLDLILFIRNEKPWDDTKYIKRFNRLFYLCFVELFLVLDSNSDRKKYLKDFCERIATRALKSNLKEQATRFNKKWGETPTGFHLLIKRIVSIAVDQQSPEIGNYRQFVELLQRNCITTLSAFKNIGQFCTKGNTLSEKRIYEADFSALGRED